jgi:hypothetical protein
MTAVDRLLWLRPFTRRHPGSASLLLYPCVHLVGPRRTAATDGSEPGAMTLRSYPGRTLMARAMTRMAMTSDRVDWTIMVSLAQRRTGRVSVGLKAVALV